MDSDLDRRSAATMMTTSPELVACERKISAEISQSSTTSGRQPGSSPARSSSSSVPIDHHTDSGHRSTTRASSSSASSVEGRSARDHGADKRRSRRSSHRSRSHSGSRHRHRSRSRDEDRSDKRGRSDYKYGGRHRPIGNDRASDRDYDFKRGNRGGDTRNRRHHHHERSPRRDGGGRRMRSRSRDRETRLQRHQRQQRSRSGDRTTRRKDKDTSRQSGHRSRSRSSELRDRHSRDSARVRPSRSPDRSAVKKQAASNSGSESNGNDDNKAKASATSTGANIEPPKNPLDKSVVEKPSNLPLLDPQTMMMHQQGPRVVTAQMAFQQTMAAMNARAQQLTGVTLPKYYNPAAVNPLKYAEQMQKRKLLWQNKEKAVVAAPSTNKWEQTTFSQDEDGKMAAKFKKLMGIKEEAAAAAAAAAAGAACQSDAAAIEHMKKQEELFRTLDQQYEVARISTHTQRGVGLGFSSSVAAAATVASMYNSHLHQQHVLPK